MQSFSDYFIKENYPSEFSFEEFDNINTYKGRLDYAKERLKRLGSGSARVIFQVDDTRILKIAKNIKGLAQNNIESDRMMMEWHGDILATVFRSGEEVKNTGPFWIEMELARKITPSEFKRLLRFSHNELQKYLASLNPRMNRYGSYNIDSELKNAMDENEFIQELMNMIANFGMSYPGDFGRVNSYGKVIRNGIPQLVLVDFGLSESVYYDYYSR